MDKVLRILLLFLMISCYKQTGSVTSSWEIISVTPVNHFFNRELIFEINGADILVRSKVTGKTFPTILKDNRLVIETGLVKWLFAIEVESDTVMILHELYSKNPLEIKLIRMKTNYKY